MTFSIHADVFFNEIFECLSTAQLYFVYRFCKVLRVIQINNNDKLKIQVICNLKHLNLKLIMKILLKE